MQPDELRDWRTHAGLTQSGLAALLGVDVRTVNRWEKGQRDIPPYLHLALRHLEMPRKRVSRSPRVE